MNEVRRKPNLSSLRQNPRKISERGRARVASRHPVCEPASLMRVVLLELWHRNTKRVSWISWIILQSSRVEGSACKHEPDVEITGGNCPRDIIKPFQEPLKVTRGSCLVGFTPDVLNEATHRELHTVLLIGFNNLLVRQLPQLCPQE